MMWNTGFTAPLPIKARELARLPTELQGTPVNAWGIANMPGERVPSFLEGPTFDARGNLYLVDIPNGRVHRVTPDLQWSVVAETGGWPNGTAMDGAGQLWIADYRLGLLRLDPATGHIDVALDHRNSESFKGLNDLSFDRTGNLYFTDQGQTGLHDPSGRVYRLRPSGQLDLLLGNVPSPNGLVLAPDERFLYVSVTRANAVWRMPLLPDGSVSKATAFHTFFGTSGPDGLAMTANGSLIVAHASLGAFVIDRAGWVTHHIQGTPGHGITNLAIRPDNSAMVLTESMTATVFEVGLEDLGLT